MAKGVFTVRRTGIALVLAAFSILSSAAHADDVVCAECHTDTAFVSPAHPDLVCADCHNEVTAEHNGNDLPPLTDDNSCGNCHGKVLRTIGRSAHDGEAACGDCHGVAHEIHLNADLASAVSPVNQIKNCGGCHDSPEMPLERYVGSEHGKALLLSGLVAAPSCSDCHGDHHIIDITSDRSPTSHESSPEVCGSCHVLVLEDWKHLSAHGLAWQDGEEGPVCTDCHSTHGIADPTTDASRLASADNCGHCHEEYLTTFRDSFHGKANDLGMVTGATCADCHTPHKNLSADNPLSSVNSANLVETCGRCHDGISEQFISFDPHNDPSNPDDNYAVYIVWLFRTP